MTEDEMYTAVEEWYDTLSPEEGLAYERERKDNNAHSPKAEYWFMKGWVARGVRA